MTAMPRSVGERGGEGIESGTAAGAGDAAISIAGMVSGMISGVLSGLLSMEVMGEHGGSPRDPSVRLRTCRTCRDCSVPHRPQPCGAGKSARREGRSSVICGGDLALFRRIEPLFRCFATTLHPVGPIGNASIVKTIDILISGITLAAACEGFLLGARAGVSTRTCSSTW